MLICPPIVLAVADKDGKVPNADPTNWRAGPWGDVLDGAQIRLFADNSRLNRGAKRPYLSIDARNFGKRELQIILAPEQMEIEVDGVWYRTAATNLAEAPVLPFCPGNRYEDLWWRQLWNFRWKERWGVFPWRSKEGVDMAFGPGKHVVRVAFMAHPAIAGAGKSLRLVSNSIQLGAASIPWRRMTLGQRVSALRDESVEESLQMLSQVWLFYRWPGSSGGAGEVQLPEDARAERVVVERIMSNRRFLKVFQELSEMSPTKAGQLVAREIERTLPAYREMSEEYWQFTTGQDKRPRSRPPSFNQISNNLDGSPTLYGLRHKLLSLVLIAGNLKLADSRPAIRSVVKEACRQRDRSYVATAEHRRLAWAMIHDVALHNRRILATGIIGTSAGKAGQLAQDDGKLAGIFESRRLTHYDAAFTYYDRHGQPDFSKGEIHVKFHKGLDDAAFDKLVALFIDGVRWGSLKP